MGEVELKSQTLHRKCFLHETFTELHECFQKLRNFMHISKNNDSVLNLFSSELIKHVTEGKIVSFCVF